MPDIDYFTKSNIENRNIVTFMDNLPSHLKTLFMEALTISYPGCRNENFNGFFIALYDYDDTNISSGIKRITCRLKTSANINFIPVFGTLMYGISNLVTNPTICLFFDAATGEMLDENEAQQRRNKNDTAEQHFKNGKSLETNNNFKEAYEEYEKALQECSYYYMNEEKFKSYRDRMTVETTRLETMKVEFRNVLDSIRIERTAASERLAGDNAFNAGEYEFAKEKYDAAYAMSVSQSDKNLYQSLVDTAKNEIDVDKLKKDGVNALTRSDFQEARKLFETGIRKSNHGEHKQVLEALKIIVNKEIAAAAHSEEARLRFNHANFTGAKQEIMFAIEKSTLESKISEHQSFLDDVNIEIRAADERTGGDIAFNKGEYDDAKEKYTKAWLTSKHVGNKNVYKVLLDSVNLEIQVRSTKEEALNAYQLNAFDQAVFLLNSAFASSKHANHQHLIKQQSDRVRNEMKVNECKQEADRCFADRDYEKSFEKYQLARQKTTREEVKSETKILLEKCENEIQALNLKKGGDELFELKDFDKAIQKYTKALKTSKIDVEKSDYTELIEKTKAEADATKEVELGDAALKEGEIERAKSHNEKALHLTMMPTTQATLSEVLKKVEILAEAIANKKVQTGQVAQCQLSSSLLEQSQLLEQGIQLIKEGEAEKAEDKIQQALNKLEDAGSFLVSGLNEGTCVVFKELKRLVTILTELKALDEASCLLEKFRARFQEYAGQIEAIQAIFEGTDGVTADFSARHEEGQENEQQKVVVLLESDVKH